VADQPGRPTSRRDFLAVDSDIEPQGEVPVNDIFINKMS
jgi:hypothetical protein